jgi:hypothetical protein
MSDGALVLVTLFGFFGSSVLLGGGVYLRSKKKVVAAQQQSIVSLRDGGIYTMGFHGKYLGMRFDPSKPKGYKCTGLLTPLKADATRVMMTKSKDTWQVKPDCDKDGKHTSFMTSEATRIVQPRNNKPSQKWSVSCSTSGQCSFLSPSNQYLSLPKLSQKRVVWTLDALE